MKNIITWLRSFILAHRAVYIALSILTLGNYHSYQQGWESGMMFDIETGS